MNYEFAVRWLKCLRTGAAAALYEDHGIAVEDPMPGRHLADGVHVLRVRGYDGDERSGLIRWEWSLEGATELLGWDVAGRRFTTHGHTFHEYSPAGRIARESSWWDASAVLRQLGCDFRGLGRVTPAKAPTAASMALTP